MDYDNRSLRQRIYDSLKDYWPIESDLETGRNQQMRLCRDQILADVREWLEIE